MELLGDVGHVRSVRLEMVLVLVQDRCTVCAKRIIGTEIILDAPMEHLGDEAQVVSRFGSFGDSANLDARNVHGLCRTYYRFQNCFGHMRWNS